VKITGFSFYKVYTDEDIVGIGPCTGGIATFVESTLIGQDPAYIHRFWDINMRGRGAVLGSSSCGGLEIALWDIIGKAANKPIYKLLGAHRDRVMAYAATGQLKSAEELASEAVEFKKRGIKAIKLRLHRPNPEDDLDVVRAVREAVGADMNILVDANQNNVSINYSYWSRRTALRVAEELEMLDVYWLEEPLPRTDLEGLAELSASVDVYIAGGEHCTNIYEFRDALFAGAYDIVQPDVILGNIGITGIRKIAVIADSVGRLIAPHVCGGGNNGIFLAATLQAIGTIDNCPFIEYTLDPPALTPEILQLVLKEPILIDEGGFVEIPQKPGIGIEINEEAVAEYI
jgi:L-alanine-DL-glutamate epimerase-like enolase superfamily enzyme